MNANDRVNFNGRNATIVAIRTDGTIALLMADTGRMIRVKGKDASKVTANWK